MTAATTANGWPGKSKLGAVLRVTSGNFLEQFDFFLFGFYATYLAKTFFPLALTGIDPGSLTKMDPVV